MKKNDYIVFKGTAAEEANSEKDDKPKYHLGRAKSPTEGGLIVLLEKDSHVETRTAEIRRKDIVVNLGPDPKPGDVYGCDVTNLHRKSLGVDEIGVDVHLFDKFNAELEGQAIKGLVKAHKRLKHHGLDFVMDGSIPIFYEVMRKSNKHAGMFRRNKKFCRVQLFVNADHTALNDYVFLHELSHVVDSYLINSPELKARWVRLYMRSVKPCTLELPEVRRMFSGIKKAACVSDWKKQFEEDDKGKPNLVLRAIKQAHGVSVLELNTLLQDSDLDTVKGLWPAEDVRSTDMNPIISDYACTNVKETFAEALSLHMLGKTLPKAVVKLVEDTIQYAIGQKVNVQRAEG
jgi:hypothetical protein